MRWSLVGLASLGMLAICSSRADAVFMSNVRMNNTVLETAVNVYNTSVPTVTTIVGRQITFTLDLYQTTVGTTTLQLTYTKSSGSLTSIGTGTTTLNIPTTGANLMVVRNETLAPSVPGTWVGTLNTNITSVTGNDYRFDPNDATDSNDLPGEPNGNLSNGRNFPISVTVLANATPSFQAASTVTTQSLNFGTVIQGYNGGSMTQGFAVNNRPGSAGAALTAGLLLTGSSTTGDTPALSTDLSTPGGPVAGGAANSYTATLNTATAGSYSESLTVNTQNDVTTPIPADTLSNLTLNMSGTVLAHSMPSLDGLTSNNLTLNLGTYIEGSGTQVIPLSVSNLINVPLLTAKLDLDSIIAAGGNSSQLSISGLAPFLNLTAGSSVPFTGLFDTSVVGSFSSTWTLNFSDENMLGATNQTLTLTLTGAVQSNVVVPEPGTMLIWSMLGLIGAGLRWRRRTSK